MKIKQCRVCGVDFDCKGASNARNCPEHRITAAKSQALYYARMKNAKRCWCGQYAKENSDFCSTICEADATRYRAHTDKHKDNPINFFNDDPIATAEQFANKVKTNYL